MPVVQFCRLSLQQSTSKNDEQLQANRCSACFLYSASTIRLIGLILPSILAFDGVSFQMRTEPTARVRTTSWNTNSTTNTNNNEISKTSTLHHCIINMVRKILLLLLPLSITAFQLPIRSHCCKSSLIPLHSTLAESAEKARRCIEGKETLTYAELEIIRDSKYMDSLCL